MPIQGQKHRFNRRNVDLAPDAPGVYALYEREEVTFYGVAPVGQTIRNRLAEHIAGRHEPGQERARLFSYEATRYPMSRECALLEEHRRANRSFPRDNVR